MDALNGALPFLFVHVGSSRQNGRGTTESSGLEPLLDLIIANIQLGGQQVFQADGRVGSDVDENPFKDAHLLDGKVDTAFVGTTITSIANPHFDLITGEASGFGEFFNTLPFLQGGHGQGQKKQLQSFPLL